jgi:uncharacterized protein YbjT (DUF2867 family)
MDAEIERSGAAYRALSMPFYMENLLGQAGAIREQGAFSLAYSADRPLPSIATRDIAATAAGLLAGRSWSGQEDLPVFGPDRLTPRAMAEAIADVVGRPVAYRELGLADVASSLAERGATERAVRDVTEMVAAQNDGIYDADQARAIPSPTDFRTWCDDVLRRAVA